MEIYGIISQILKEKDENIMANIREVAKKANVSVATVSRVINQNGNVKENTRNHVLAVLDELGYGCDKGQSERHKKKVKRILVLLPDIANPFYSIIAQGVCETARKKDYLLMLCTTEGSYENEKHYIDMLRTGVADGAIMFAPVMGKAELVELDSEKHIVQCCEYEEEVETVSHISIDNYAAGVDAVQHLINIGHKKIAMISCGNGFLSTAERENAYKDTLKKNGIEFNPQYLAKMESDYGYRTGIRSMNYLLNLKEPPTAVFAVSDIVAIGAMQAIQKAGLSIPEDVAVVGFDDLDVASLYNPPLTTIYQPKEDIGRLAMELLDKKINGIEPEYDSIFLEHELRIRKSTVR